MVVYPRWRGELNIGNGFAAAASGLSPLARGTHYRMDFSGFVMRFIPAGAGNTRSETYPKGSEFGLSPLARGTHDLQVTILR